jgi:hypothetical protein
MVVTQVVAFLGGEELASDILDHQRSHIHGLLDHIAGTREGGIAR